jgi:hypothetical protein
VAIARRAARLHGAGREEDRAPRSPNEPEGQVESRFGGGGAAKIAQRG